MKKLFAFSLLLLVFVSSAAGQNWFKGTLDDAFTEAKKEGKMVLVDFFSPG
ncbi:MAG: hypothetical protein KAU47_01195 [Candidatus Aminicenantes bacterium]|nr:hypothetical protein [Candidatus Aminicenantes bacterium]MCK4758791.1 hypothetical protein [Candidatus Aminicenantes bacterium]